MSTCTHLGGCWFFNEKISTRQSTRNRNTEFLRGETSILQKRKPGVTHYYTKPHTHTVLCIALNNRVSYKEKQHLWLILNTWSFKSFFLFSAGFGSNVTGHVIEREEQMVFLMKMCGELDLHLSKRFTKNISEPT